MSHSAVPRSPSPPCSMTLSLCFCFFLLFVEASAILLASNSMTLPHQLFWSLFFFGSHSHGPTRMNLLRLVVTKETHTPPLSPSLQSTQHVPMPSSRVVNLQIRLALASILKLDKKQKHHTPPNTLLFSRLLLGFLALFVYVPQIFHRDYAGQSSLSRVFCVLFFVSRDKRLQECSRASL
ncbi:hypothetical protein LCI18_014684 [Fusarium solani-melongenae]|uniref:Uncharacterized protein n=1 Tax=Fusarium solani subsp. cucurbitae TaxID=2747967 RepID=A0ACD3ZQV9_FUSSC|nr:hypothetical protein LCI18_014684 [Fusarium solani-melongenae]